MPQVNLQNQDFLLKTVKQIQQQIQQLTTQQNQAIVDNNNRTRILIGLLPDGDYGISLIDTLGNVQELLPSVTAYFDGTLSTTSATPVSLTGSPSVTVELGSSGDALITVGSFIGTNATNLSGFINLYANGTLIGAEVVGAGASASTVAGNFMSKRKLSQWTGALAANTSYTFTLQYFSSTSGQQVNFSSNYLEVTPI
jgi:hypothetical protein